MKIKRRVSVACYKAFVHVRALLQQDLRYCNDEGYRHDLETDSAMLTKCIVAHERDKPVKHRTLCVATGMSFNYLMKHLP